MKKNICSLKLSFIALCIGTLASQADPVTWTGANSANWSDPGNWNPGLPNPEDTLIFDTSSQTSPNNDLTAQIFGGITFTATGSTYILGGNSITLDTAIVVNNNTVLQTLAFPVVLTNAVTFNTVSNDNSGVSGDLEVSGAISGGATGSLIKNGGGTLTLDSIGYSGTTTVNGGLLVVSNNNGNYTMSGGALLLNFRTYYTGIGISLTADSSVGIDLLDNTEPRGIDCYSTIGTAGFKFTKIGQGLLRMVGSINASAIDVADGTLGSLGGGAGGGVGVEPATKWGISPITVESGAMLRADDGGVCPNAIVLNGGDGTMTGSYTHLGALISSSRNNGASVTNFNIFTNTITLAADSTIGSYYNTMIIAGNMTGSGALTAIGTSPFLLSGSNSFAGSLTLNASTVQVGSSNALPAGVSVTLIAGAKLDLDGTNGFIGGQFSDDGSGLGAADNSSANAASLSLNGGYFVGQVKNSGGGPLSIVNVSGSTSLLGANSYTGANVVQAGTLEINIPTGTTTGGLVQVADNAVLTLHKTTPGSSLKASGATFGTSGATTLNIDLNNYGNPSTPIINATNGTGVLSANGTLTINFNNTANLAVGQFAIIKYTSRSDTGNFVFNPINGITAQIVTNTANKSIDLQITSAPIMTWNGNHNNLWDTTTANWTLSGSPVLYSDGTPVYFDDTALTNNVNLTTAVSPGSVLLNTTNIYTFGGTGSLSGGTLTKNGSGTLIMDISGNGYASTVIGGGILQVGNNDANGDLAFGPVDDEATLSFNLTNALTLANSISGAGIVVQNNTNTITLGSASTYSGGTLVNQGVVKQGIATALGTPTTSTVLATVASGAALDLGGYTPSVTNAVVLNGNGNGTANQGALFTSTSGWTYLGGTEYGINGVNLASDTSVGNNSGWFCIGKNGVNGIAGNNHNLTKVGSNIMPIEAPASSALASMTVGNGGLLLYNQLNWFGSAAILNISNNATIDSWNPINWTGITVPNNIVIASSGGQILDSRGAYYGQADQDTYNGSITLNGPLTIRCTSTYNGSPNGQTYGKQTFNGAISGISGVIVTVTTGDTITFNGTANYTGPTVNTGGAAYGGKFLLSLVQQGGGAYTNDDGGILDVPSQTGYATVPMSTLALLGTNSGAILSLGRLTSLSTSNAPITATNLVLTGTNSILAPGFVFASAGQYPLIKYTTLSGDVTNLALGAAGIRGVPGYLSNNVANGSIDLVVAAANPVNWVGNVNSNWDIASTMNWLYQATSTTYQQNGSLGDAVTFDDSTTQTNVNITTPVSPTLVIVNTTNNYVFFGTNITGGATLIKNGAGVLTLSNLNNNLTGGSYVNAGTLRMGTGLNNLTGIVTVGAGATIDLASNNPSAMVITASGPGVGTNGAIQANYSGAATAQGPSIVNQTGNLTIGGNNRWDVRNGSKQWNVSTNGFTLTKVGAGYVGLNGVTVSTNLGDITILGGTLSYQAATTGLGNTNNTIYVGNGGTLDFNSSTIPLTKGIVCSNGAAIASDGGNAANLNVISSPVNLVSGNVSLNLNYYNGIIFSNTISGAGGISLQFQSIVTMAASNTYTGNTTVPRCNSASGGLGTRLILIGNGSIANSALITLQGIQSGQAYAAYLDVLGRSDGTLTLAANQTLRGDNGSFVRGKVVALAGSTISVGGVSSNYQYMSFSNTLAFQSGSTNIMDIYKAGTLLTNDLINVSNLVTYAGTLQIQINGPTSLIVGDAFKLFNAGSSAGNFTTIADASGTTWSFNPATGVATVLTVPPPVNTNPATANFQASVVGGALQFSWAPDHQGWQLYTNPIGLTATSSWFPVPGSAAVTNETVTINPANTNVFFQLRYP